MELNEPNTAKVDQKGLKWTEWIEVDRIGPMWTK